MKQNIHLVFRRRGSNQWSIDHKPSALTTRPRLLTNLLKQLKTSNQKFGRSFVFWLVQPASFSYLLFYLVNCCYLASKVSVVKRVCRFQGQHACDRVWILRPVGWKKNSHSCCKYRIDIIWSCDKNVEWKILFSKVRLRVKLRGYYNECKERKVFKKKNCQIIDLLSYIW